MNLVSDSSVSLVPAAGAGSSFKMQKSAETPPRPPPPPPPDDSHAIRKFLMCVATVKELSETYLTSVSPSEDEAEVCLVAMRLEEAVEVMKARLEKNGIWYGKSSSNHSVHSSDSEERSVSSLFSKKNYPLERSLSMISSGNPGAFGGTSLLSIMSASTLGSPQEMHSKRFVTGGPDDEV